MVIQTIILYKVVKCVREICKGVGKFETKRTDEFIID